MRPINYAALTTFAGEFLGEPRPEPIQIGSGESVPAFPVAVYVAVGLDGSVLYVGSVCRPQDEQGVGSRLDEHLRKLDRFQTWNLLYVIPLRPDTPLSTVRRIEGRVGAHLAPAKSRALPRLRGR